MTPRRFHVPSLTDDRITIEGEQAHHARTVLRMKPDDPVVLFDGRGAEATGVIESVSPEAVAIRVVDRMTDSAVGRASLVIASAVPKGERADWMVEKCAELGVSSIWWVAFERSVVAPGSGKIDRWTRKAVEAARQARRSHVMQIEPLQSLDAALQRHESTSAGMSSTQPLRFFGDPAPDAMSLSKLLNEETMVKARHGFVFVGPEGGLTAAETARLRRGGFAPVRWSDGILRIETAAVTLAAVWFAMQSINQSQ